MLHMCLTYTLGATPENVCKPGIIGYTPNKLAIYLEDQLHITSNVMDVCGCKYTIYTYNELRKQHKL